MSVYTLAQYQALCEAIALGAKAVKYADKEVIYRTEEEMDIIKRKMEVDLNINQNNDASRSGRRVADYCDPYN